MIITFIRLSILAACGFFAGTALAAGYSDDFNRTDTPSPAGGLGSAWRIEGDAFINGDVAKTQTAKPCFAVYRDAKLSKGFTVEVDVYAQANGRYAGVVFNYVNPKTYYLVRVSFNEAENTAWQFIKLVDGVQTVVAAGSIPSGDMPLKTWRKIMVTAKTGPGSEGRYSFQITDMQRGSVLVSESLMDADIAPSGFSGFYFGSSFIWADNFSMMTPSSIPEPSVMALAAGIFCVGVATLLRKKRTARDC